VHNGTGKGWGWFRKALERTDHKVCHITGADKSLAPPGRKQATATEDFEFNISYL